MLIDLYAVSYLIVVEVGQTSLNREWKTLSKHVRKTLKWSRMNEKICDEVNDEFGRKKTNERSFLGRLGKLGLKINGGRDRPCVPGDPGIFITTVKRGSVFDKVLGPGDKILKVPVVCARVLRVYQY